MSGDWLQQAVEQEAAGVAAALKGGSIPRADRKRARALLGQAWSWQNTPEPPDDQGMALCRQLGALIDGDGLDLHFAQRLTRRHHRLWPIKIPAISPNLLVERILGMEDAQQDRIDRLQAFLDIFGADMGLQRPQKARPWSHNALSMNHDQFPVVEKQGRQ